MVIINCKKCLKDVDMPNRRFKICINCNTRKKKQSIEKTDNSTSMLFNYTPENVIYEIVSFLTIADTYNIYLTSKEYKNILTDEIIWKNHIYRDYNISNFIYKPIYFAINLDLCYICHICLKTRCEKNCINNKKIFKTSCIKDYYLEEKELDKIQCELKRHSQYKNIMSLYNMSDVLKLVSQKFNGYVNFVHYKNNEIMLKKIKKETQLENNKKKLIEYVSWQKKYRNTFNYSHLSKEQRREMLKEYLSEHNILQRADSQLCISFINGNVKDKSLENIAALLYLTQILFSYSHIVYSNYNEQCKREINLKMFEMDQKKKENYTWFDAVDDVHEKHKSKFNSCRYNEYNHYYYF